MIFSLRSQGSLRAAAPQNDDPPEDPYFLPYIKGKVEIIIGGQICE
jgi:hypothetical protein